MGLSTASGLRATHGRSGQDVGFQLAIPISRPFSFLTSTQRAASQPLKDLGSREPHTPLKPPPTMEGKVIAISGGSSGMGLELAKLLASRGATLSICDVVQSNLDKATSELSLDSSRFLAVPCDVRKLSEVNNWISKTVEKFGRLDGAANMAGIIGAAPGKTPVTEQDEEDWERIIGVNLTVSFGVFLGGRFGVDLCDFFRG